MERWSPRKELSKQEKFISQRLKRVRALFGFLRLSSYAPTCSPWPTPSTPPGLPRSSRAQVSSSRVAPAEESVSAA